jgi:hypothetical protein
MRVATFNVVVGAVVAGRAPGELWPFVALRCWPVKKTGMRTKTTRARMKSAENLTRAIGYFEQATEQDPQYALAYAG